MILMSCDRLYNLYKSSTGPEKQQHYTAWMQCRSSDRSDAQAKQQAASAFYAKQADTAAMYARGEHLKDLSTPTNIPGSNFVLPSVQQQALRGKSSAGLIVAGVLSAVTFIGLAMFMMMKNSGRGRGRGGYQPYPQQPYYPGPRAKKKKRK